MIVNPSMNRSVYSPPANNLSNRLDNLPGQASTLFSPSSGLSDQQASTQLAQIMRNLVSNVESQAADDPNVDVIELNGRRHYLSGNGVLSPDGISVEELEMLEMDGVFSTEATSKEDLERLEALKALLLLLILLFGEEIDILEFILIIGGYKAAPDNHLLSLFDNVGQKDTDNQSDDNMNQSDELLK